MSRSRIIKTVKSNLRRGVKDPGFERIELTPANKLDDITLDSIGGKPGHSAQKGKYGRGGQSHFLIGDKANSNLAKIRMGIDDEVWLSIKPVVLTDPLLTIVKNNGNKIVWKNTGKDGQHIDVIAEFTGAGVKTSLVCDSVNPLDVNYDNLYLTVELPVGAEMQMINSGEYAGEIKILYGGVEKCYVPRPSVWDANGIPIPSSHEIIPAKPTAWGTLPAIKINVVIDPNVHVAPITIDPSFNFSYTDVIYIKAKVATAWPTFDRTGSGKSWGAAGENLGNFPEVPIMVSRQNDDMFIIDPSLSGASQPWISWLTTSTLNMFYGSGYAKNLDIFDGYLIYTYSGTDNGLFINFSENWGSGSNRTAYHPGLVKVYNGQIQQRNAGSGWISDSQFSAVKKLTSSNNKSIIITDGSGNKYYVYAGRIVGFTTRLVVQPVDLLGELGYGNSSLTGANDLTEFDVPSNGTVAIALNQSPNIFFITQAEWTKVISSGEFTNKFLMSGWDMGFSPPFDRMAKVNNRIVAVTSNASTKGLVVIKGNVMVGAYSGTVSLNTLRTNGDAYIVSYIGDTKDFNIVPADVGNATWSHCATVEGENLVICGTALGLFCIDFSDPDLPVYNGKLTSAAATGIFANIPVISGSTDIQAVGCGKISSNRYISFATTDTFYVYDESLDVDPPTVTGQNPANLETGIAINSSVYFELDDNISGVDSSTINVTIESVDAIINGVFQTGYSGLITADGLGFNITIDHAADWGYSQVINVSVTAADQLGNTISPAVTWSFTTEPPDTTPPSETEIISPLFGEWTSNRPQIELKLSTDPAGVSYRVQYATDEFFTTESIVKTTAWQDSRFIETPIDLDKYPIIWIRGQTRDKFII